MIELAWFAAGAAVTAAATVLLRTRGRTQASSGPQDGNQPGSPPSRPLPQQEPPAAPQAPARGHANQAVTPPHDPRAFAISLAEELASLASGVEGRAHALIECAPHRAMLPAAAEGLLVAIHRLRTLHRKLVAFGQDRSPESGSTDIGELVISLSDELQHMQLGLEVRWDPPPILPRLAANRDVVREALLFLCAALLRAERGATRLSITAEQCFAEATPVLELELGLEWVVERTSGRTDPGSDAGFSIEHEAAANLLRSQGGEVTFSHLPGRSACAVVRLPALVWTSAQVEARNEAAPRKEAPSTAVEGPPAEPSVQSPAPVTAQKHRYGGALVLEADPSVRAMLASELKATGRAVFACADGASARSFLAATPERFEVLIVDHHHRLEGDDALGETIRSMAPDLKICVLSPANGHTPGAWPQVFRIEKPFGVHELRTALATVLAFG